MQLAKNWFGEIIMIAIVEFYGLRALKARMPPATLYAETPGYRFFNSCNAAKLRCPEAHMK